MAKFAIIFVVLCVAIYGVQANPMPDQDERDLISVIQKALVQLQAKEGKTGDAPDGGNVGLDKNDGREGVLDDANFDPEDLEGIFKFPGSDFMIRMIMQWLRAAFPDVSQIEEFRSLDEAVLNRIEAIIPNLEEIVGTDFNSFAEIMTRFLTKAVFDIHVNCPSSLLNKFVTRLWEQNERSMFSEDSPLFPLFRTKIARFWPMFAEDEFLLKKLTTEMVKHTGEMIMGDTEEFLLGLGFLDVAKFSNLVYKKFETYPDLDLSNFEATVTDLIVDSEVGCHSWTDVFGYHNSTFEMFLAEFDSIEDREIEEELGEFLWDSIERVIYTHGNEVDVDALWENIDWDVVEEMAADVGSYITNIVIPEMEGYLGVIASKDTESLLGFFDFLGATERSVLTEILTRLGWPRVTTTTPTVIVQPTILRRKSSSFEYFKRRFQQ